MLKFFQWVFDEKNVEILVLEKFIFRSFTTEIEVFPQLQPGYKVTMRLFHLWVFGFWNHPPQDHQFVCVEC